MGANNSSTPIPGTEHLRYAHECRIRDLYAQELAKNRPNELVVGKERRYRTARRRVDLRTVDKSGLLREWEFKIRADYRTLGQILLYLAHARREVGFDRPVRGVIAAFVIPDELRLAVEVMNLNLELVTIPTWMRWAGEVPSQANAAVPKVPRIPLRGES